MPPDPHGAGAALASAPHAGQGEGAERSRMGEEAPILEAERVSLRFGGVRALTDVSFSVRRGEIFSIIGPNGAGKTSMVNCISGRYRPTEGRIRFEGRGARPEFGIEAVPLAAEGEQRALRDRLGRERPAFRMESDERPGEPFG